MVTVTRENWDKKNIVIKKVEPKNKDPKKKVTAKTEIFYRVGDGEEKIELVNYGKIKYPADVNGLMKETNYTTKQWTGNYKPGLKFPESSDVEKEAARKDLLAFYNQVYEDIKEVYGKTKEVCPNPIHASLVESFVKYPEKKVNGVETGEKDLTKPPAIWAKSFYKIPEGVPKESQRPEDIVPSVSIHTPIPKDRDGNPLKDKDGNAMKPEYFTCQQLEKTRFDAFFRVQLGSIEANPKSGGKVITTRLEELTVNKSTFREASEGGFQPKIDADFD